MKAFIALCFLFVCVYSSRTFDATLDSTWALYKRTYEKQYASSAEESKRRSIWEDHVALIKKHNLEADLGLHTYTLGMNKYADLTNQEFVKQMNGFRRPSNLSFPQTCDTEYVAPSNFKRPDSVDWRPKGYVTPIKDQGQCGSCWAFSTVAALEGQTFAKTGKLISLSEQNLVDCSTSYGNQGCNGGLMDPSFQYIRDNKGIDTEDSYPYEGKDGKCRFNAAKVGATDTGCTDIKAQSEDDLQDAIATVGPISVAIDASHTSFQLYKSGVYIEPFCSATQLDHAVLAVGYGKQGTHDYYIVKNSWGTSWGNDGYILMARNRNNQCGIATNGSFPKV
ncbi:unnamed protein product [Adineta ricciae]|uniref:Uncharacterized protein n=1 Tax=Adineta ricciae TaxID=249248 RepID=A0A814WX96_ADIRI|nr:unnamed protein product [Adineta ricciae]CAF1464913.1 unnamed protein product [Adineta ricciae]